MDLHDKYHKTPRQMTEITTALVTQAKVVIGLGRALHNKGRGAKLVYVEGGQEFEFTQQDLSAAQKALYRAIKGMDMYFKYSRKNKRGPVTPGEFKGVYSPVVLGDVLREFFNDRSFDPIVGNLRVLRAGLALRNTLTMLFYLYAHQESLQVVGNGSMIAPNPVMSRVFGTLHPLYTSVRVPFGRDANGNVKYVKNKDFAGPEVRSTFEVISALASTDPKIPEARQALQMAQAMPALDAKSLKMKEKAIRKAEREITRRSFRPNEFASFNFQVLAGLNYAGFEAARANADFFPTFRTTDGRTITAADALISGDYQQFMLSDHDAVKRMSDAYRAARDAEKARR